jgi:hypothetical protein
MGRRILPASLLAGFVAIFPTIVQGQGRAVMYGGGHSMTVAPMMVGHVAPSGARAARPGARMVVRTGAPHSRMATTVRSTGRPVALRRHVDFDDRELKPGCSTVPGLGFDVPHLAAVCGPEAVGAGRSGDQVFFPFLDSGFIIPSSLAIGEQGAAPEPQQAEDAEAEAGEAPRRTKVSRQGPAPEIEVASAAPRQSEEYVFVRRDGTVFFAVAYAWENGTLRYITSEGLRRSLARDALDLDATQQFNEQRGMNFRLPV